MKVSLSGKFIFENTKRIRFVWDKFNGKPKRILAKASEIEAFETIIEVTVEAYESPIKTGPTVSESSAGPRRSQIPFYALSTRAQELQSAKIRLEYPAGVVIKAAEQVIRQQGQSDLADVVKTCGMHTEKMQPDLAMNAKIALKLENPGNFEML